jgi:oligosaccharide repeat unit polymerase
VAIILLLMRVVHYYPNKKNSSTLNFELKQFLNSRQRKIKKYIKYLLLIYILIAILDVFYSRGVPIIWALTGSSRSYVDFGVPTLHGIANSIVFFLASLLTLLTILKVKNYKGILFALIVYQVLILSRGTIIVMTVQMLAVFLFISRMGFLKNIGIVVFLLVFVVAFGMLGDLRQGANPYYGLLTDEWKELFNSLPSGFLWAYIYVSSGLNNLNFNVGIIEPSYIPVYTFAKLVPSIIYNFFSIEKVVDTFTFVNAGLNVSTIYSAFYSDFGILSFLLVMVIQLVASNKYNLARKGNIYSLLSYVVAYQAIFLSFFIDTFFYIPFLFQFVIVYFFKVALRAKTT